MSKINPKWLAEFKSETEEHIASLGEDLIFLDMSVGAVSVINHAPIPADRTLINRIFRTIHNIKGNAGFFALKNITNLTHTMESCFALVRDEQIIADKGFMVLFLNAFDLLCQMVNNIEKSEEIDATKVIQNLVATITAAGETFKPLDSDLCPVDSGQCPETSDQCPVDSDQCPETSDQRPETSGQWPVSSDQKPVSPPQKDFLRVSVHLLDDIMASTSELVLARNRLSRLVNSIDSSFRSAEFGVRSADISSQWTVASSQNLDKASLVSTGHWTQDTGHLLKSVISIAQQIDMITSQLQERIMSTRLQPISMLFHKFTLLVKNLETTLNKKLKLEISGEDVYVDKAIIENLSDPLTHIVRNAAHHGIENTTKRLNKGKPEVGTIKLKAYQNGGMIYIEVSDDGDGFDEDKILARALDMGLCTIKSAMELDKNQILDFVYTPGFSTTHSIDTISGRGVGMDIVLTNIANYGGRVKIDTTAGKGTTITLTQPLTLAIIPAVIFIAEKIHFVVAQNAISEFRIIKRADYAKVLKFVSKVLCYHLEDRVIPLINFYDYFGREKPKDIPKSIHILILKYESHEIGLMVENIVDNEDIVVRPIPRFFKASEIYLGTTILGDGSIGLILDVTSIIQKVRLDDEGTTPLSFKGYKDKISDNPDRSEECEVQSAECGSSHIPHTENPIPDNVTLPYPSLKGGMKVVIWKDDHDKYFAIDLEKVQNVKMVCSDEFEKIKKDNHLEYKGIKYKVIKENYDLSKRKYEDFNFIFTKGQTNPVCILTTRTIDIVDSAEFGVRSEECSILNYEL